MERKVYTVLSYTNQQDARNCVQVEKVFFNLSEAKNFAKHLARTQLEELKKEDEELKIEKDVEEEYLAIYNDEKDVLATYAVRDDVFVVIETTLS